jgi:hypothetical protein
MPIVITPNNAAVTAPGATTAPVVLQPGSVIDARVVQILGNDTVRIAIGNQSIDVLSQVPLQAGQTLQLAVSQAADGSIRLAVVDAQAASQAINAAGATTPDSITLAPDATAGIFAPAASGVAARNQLTPLQALAVSLAAQTAATQQTSLAPLFANLGVAAGLAGLPPQLQQAVAQVLAQRTSLDQGLTGNDVKQAFQNSGLFLEASLATGSLSPSGATPDLKAALIVLRQVLATALNGATATQSALTTQSALATPGAPALAAAVQQGVTSPAATVQQGATPTAAVTPQGTTSTVAVAQQGTTPVAVAPAQGTPPSIQVSSQPVTIIADSKTLTTVSPALAPLLASEIAVSAVSLQGAVVPVAPDILNFSAVNQIISPAATPAVAAARPAASSAAINLLQEALQAGPLTAANLSGLGFEDSQMLSLLPAVAGARATRIDDGEFARTNVPPPPIGGALPAAQPVMPATLVSNSSSETAIHHLLADTDGAIARQTLLQVASLPDRIDAGGVRVDQAPPRWNFEIPFAMSQGTAMAQFEISRDAAGNEVDGANRVWRARFSLDVEPAGPVHALVSLSGDKTSVRMWAERPATAAQLRAGTAQLSQALSKADLQPADIVIRDGTPPRPAPARAGHFLDRAL